MDLVKRNREQRITLSTALQRLQQLVNANQPPALEPEVVVELECMMSLSVTRHVRFGCGHPALCRDCCSGLSMATSPPCPVCRQPVVQEGLINACAGDTYPL
jgi:hypothetical protein